MTSRRVSVQNCSTVPEINTVNAGMIKLSNGTMSFLLLEIIKEVHNVNMALGHTWILVICAHFMYIIILL